MSESLPPPQPVTGPPLVDPGNTYLQPYPASILFGVSPDRKTLILTIRSGPATLTLMFGKEGADKLIGDATIARGHLTDLIMPDGVDILQLRNGSR